MKRMSLRQALFFICLGISLACLAGGYGMTGQWMGAGLVLLPTVAWSFSRRYPHAWLAPACLASFVFLAASGLLAGAPGYLMMIGSAAALAGWDLKNLDRTMEDSSPSETARQFERNHLRSLAIALGLGLLMAVTGSLITLQVPFVILIALVLLNLFGLDRVFHYLKNRRAEE